MLPHSQVWLTNFHDFSNLLRFINKIQMHLLMIHSDQFVNSARSIISWFRHYYGLQEIFTLHKLLSITIKMYIHHRNEYNFLRILGKMLQYGSICKLHLINWHLLIDYSNQKIYLLILFNGLKLIWTNSYIFIN